MSAIQNHKALWRKKRQCCDAKDVKRKPKTASHVKIAESKCRPKVMQRILKQNLRKAIIYDKPRPAARGICCTMGICYHLEIGSKNQKFLEHLKSAA